MKIRKIIHIDMDAFYASVEQRDHPELKGKPVVVGGDPNSRGVVATCSYEARKFGVHSAMPSSHAFRLCPDCIFIRPNFKKYSAVSTEIRKIFFEYTDLVEPLSLDEAFLDVTSNKKGKASATEIAREIKERILAKTGLTASAGVSYNKFIAKIASDFNKPDGLTVVRPEQGERFLELLPVRKFFGIGPVTEKKMLKLGISKGADLKKRRLEEMKEYFGKSGEFFYEIVRGIDNRPVNPNRIRKSLGKEVTLSKDLEDQKEMVKILEKLALQIEEQLKKNKIKIKTITLKVKYHNFKSITRSVTIKEPVCDAVAIMSRIKVLLHRTEAGQKRVRLLGISTSNFVD